MIVLNQNNVPGEFLTNCGVLSLYDHILKGADVEHIGYTAHVWLRREGEQEQNILLYLIFYISLSPVSPNIIFTY